MKTKRFRATSKPLTFVGNEKHYLAIQKAKREVNGTTSDGIRKLLDEAIAHREAKGEVFWTSWDACKQFEETRASEAENVTDL